MIKLETAQAAGGLVIDRNERILFIFKDGRWDLPKGLVERKSRPASYAAREVAEETGLELSSLSVAAELIPTSHISKFGKKRYLKKTRWFLVLCHDPDQEFVPQRSEGIEHCEWIPSWDIERPLANCPARIRYLISFWLKARKDIDFSFDR